MESPLLIKPTPYPSPKFPILPPSLTTVTAVTRLAAILAVTLPPVLNSQVASQTAVADLTSQCAIFSCSQHGGGGAADEKASLADERG